MDSMRSLGWTCRKSGDVEKCITFEYVESNN